MGEPTGIHDWELLHGAVSPTAAAADAFVGVEGDADGAIKSDYFSLKSGERCSRRASSDGGPESVSLPDSDKPTWVDPDSDSRSLGEPSRGELGFAGSGCPRADPGGFWTSDESSDGQESSLPPDHSKGDLAGSVSLPSESALEGVHTEAIEGKDVAEGGSEGSGELLKGPMEENTDLGNQTVAGGDNAWMGWWKLPVEILKFCAFRIKPVWSISIAATLVGIVMLWRRLYRKKPKRKNLQLKISVDDKKVSQFRGHAARLNEAFSAVKQAPITRSTLATSGVTPWPVLALR